MAGSALTVVAVALAFCGITATAGAEHSRRSQIVLRIHNRANVSADVLARAGAHVTRVYAAADIDILWHAGDGPAPASDLRLTIVITTTPPSELGAGRAVLGTAVEAERSCGRVAYALWHRVVESASTENRAVEMVLGYVIAHEVGHLLLPPPSHAASGIMRAAWNRKDLDDAERDRLRFRDEQAQRIRRRIAIEPTLIASR